MGDGREGLWFCERMFDVKRIMARPTGLRFQNIPSHKQMDEVRNILRGLI